MGQSRGEQGGAGSLSAAALKEAVTAAVQEALTHLAPAPAEGENAAAATAQQLNAAFAELRNMINNVASPAQGAVIVKKAKRYELWPLDVARKGALTARATKRVTRDAARQPKRAAHCHVTAPSAGDARRLRAAPEERSALQASR